MDTNLIYGGSPPQKAAGWERKGMDALRDAVDLKSGVGGCKRYYDARASGAGKKLHFPLAVTLDYLGHRLTATSLLPVNGDTLVHGISDARELAVRGVRDGGECKILLDRVAARIGLAKHAVGRGGAKAVISHAADLEVHKGTDGRYYVLDTARVLPPRFPFEGEGGTQRTLTELFRAEFCRRIKGGLSSDGMSGFTHPDDREEGRKRIRDATVFLEDDLVPLVAKNLDEAHGGAVKRPAGRHLASAMVERAEDVLLTLHRCGLNYQHLGLVRAKCTDQHLRDLLLAEMIARVGKEDVREMWRERGKGVKLPGRRAYTFGLVEVSVGEEGQRH